MNLADVLKLECCTQSLEARTKDDALLNLARLLKKSEELKSLTAENIFQALKAREDMGSTGFGRGIAIPHCQVEGIDSFVIGLATSRKGIDFDALDRKKTRIFVVIVGPSSDRSGHLQLLAQISQILKEHGVVDELLKTNTHIALYEEFLRNAGNGLASATRKTADKLMLLTVKDEEIMEDLTEIFIQFGIEESTIIDTSQMENLLSKVPLFMGFFNFTGEKNPFSKIILLKLNKEYLEAMIKHIEDVFGDLNNFSGLSIMVIDLYYSKG